MTTNRSRAYTGSESAPKDFLPIREDIAQGLERSLGYFGDDRWVLFYYEPRGAEVVWMDQYRSGIGFGGWRVFLDRIVSLAARYGVHAGDSLTGPAHVLVLDRLTGLAYFAPRASAQRLISGQGGVAA